MRGDQFFVGFYTRRGSGRKNGPLEKPKTEKGSEKRRKGTLCQITVCLILEDGAIGALHKGRGGEGKGPSRKTGPERCQDLGRFFVLSFCV